MSFCCRHDYSQRNYVAAAQQLADMQAAGKIRRIGLTNFDVRRTAEMLDASVPLVSNQVHSNSGFSCLNLGNISYGKWPTCSVRQKC